MAQGITRKTLKVFGSAGATINFAEFGSQAAGSPIKTKDISSIQDLAAWVNGWQDAVTSGSNPYLEDMNSVQYLFAYMIAYLYQEGIPEYDGGTTYNIGSIVKSLYTGYFNDTNFYVSKVDANLGNGIPSGASSDSNWAFLCGYDNVQGFQVGNINFLGTISKNGTSIYPVKGSTANSGGSAQDISVGTVSTPDLRASAVTFQVTEGNNLTGGPGGFTIGSATGLTTIGGYVLLIANVGLVLTNTVKTLAASIYIARNDLPDGVPNAFSDNEITFADGVDTSYGGVLNFTIAVIDAPAAGTYTYQLYGRVTAGALSEIEYFSLSVIEIRR
jgi:hypothetical protein